MKKIKNTWGQVQEKYTNFDLVAEYFLAKPDQKNEDTIDERTMKDLDFQAFFKFLDRTTSDIGQQYLYNQLRTLKRPKASLTELEQKIEFYTNKQQKRKRIQEVLVALSKGDDYYYPFLLYGVLPIKWRFFWVVQIIQLLVWIFILAGIFLNPVFWLWLVILIK